MVNERVPRGYNRRDKPLPHEMHYRFQLDLATAAKRATMLTMMRTTKGSNDPATIEVNPRNSNFAVDAGSVICYDSIVQKLTMSLDFTLSEHAIDTDGIKALGLYYFTIAGAWEDSWTPADEGVTTNTIADLLEITSEATTNDDVTPTFNGNDLSATSTHPLSTVTMSEAFGDLNLSGANNIEGITFDQDQIYDAKQYYTNGGKLNTLMGHIHKVVLTENRPHKHVMISKFVPRKVRYGNPHLYFGTCLLQVLGWSLVNLLALRQEAGTCPPC